MKFLILFLLMVGCGETGDRLLDIIEKEVDRKNANANSDSMVSGEITETSYLNSNNNTSISTGNKIELRDLAELHSIAADHTLYVLGSTEVFPSVFKSSKKLSLYKFDQKLKTLLPYLSDLVTPSDARKWFVSSNVKNIWVGAQKAEEFYIFKAEDPVDIYFDIESFFGFAAIPSSDTAYVVECEQVWRDEMRLHMIDLKGSVLDTKRVLTGIKNPGFRAITYSKGFIWILGYKTKKDKDRMFENYPTILKINEITGQIVYSAELKGVFPNDETIIDIAVMGKKLYVGANKKESFPRLYNFDIGE